MTSPHGQHIFFLKKTAEQITQIIQVKKCHRKQNTKPADGKSQESRKTVKQGTWKAGEPESRKQESRTAGQQESRKAGKQESRKAGK